MTVAKGESATFAIAASAGYEISDVTVDGASVGKVESYTFSDVSANHTIEAKFAKAAAKFDNDFESDDFPGNGWTVKSTNTSGRFYNWYSGKLTTLNSTKQARIDLDYYDDPWGSGYSTNGTEGDVKPMANDKVQDEYLISPAVDLTGKSATVSFDYALMRTILRDKIATFTFEASTDGGNTWTVLWNAADLENVSGMYFKGTAEVEVPETYRTANAQFAFHFYKKANTGYTDADGMFAIDNVKLVSGSSDPCADGHTLTHHEAVAATCTASGMKEYWSCDVCGKLFADEAATTETTLEALTLAALGHTMTFHEAKAATCTETGNVAYYSCSRCGKNFSDEAGTTEITDVTIPASGHTLTHHEAVKATCTEDGTKEYWECSVCGKKFADAEGKTEITDVTIPASGHTLTHHEAVKATCTEDGTKEYWECSVCGKKFADAEGKTEITDVTVKATGHDFSKEVVSAATKRSDATTTERATYWYTCANCGEVSSEKFFYYGEVLPTEPTKPTEPEKPTEPKPTDPTKPSETTEPTKDTEPEETTKPTEAPTEPTKPTVTPGTGDPADLALMASMAAVALTGMMAMAFVLLKKRKNG